MLVRTESALSPALKGKLMSTSPECLCCSSARATSTLSSLNPLSPSFLQKRCTLGIETCAARASSLMVRPCSLPPSASTVPASCCSAGVKPSASSMRRLMSMAPPPVRRWLDWYQMRISKRVNDMFRRRRSRDIDLRVSVEGMEQAPTRVQPDRLRNTRRSSKHFAVSIHIAKYLFSCLGASHGQGQRSRESAVRRGSPRRRFPTRSTASAA